MVNNQEIVNKFFEAYIKRDLEEIRKVMSEKVTWTFLGQHKLAGVKKGLDEVIAFFDLMGKIMSTSNPKVEKLVIGSNDNYLIEYQSIKTNRSDNNNIEHEICVLWTFEEGKIISGKHFFSEAEKADNFFNLVS